MTGPSPGTKICLAARAPDIRSGFDTLASKAQTALETDPYSGHELYPGAGLAR